ncbi:MAG: alpha-mannosidase [Anaerolineae bacterium]|nr:alpha-mannosidase [Anaerolineae bacterium]
MDPRIIRMKLDILHRRAIVRAWPISPYEARTADHLAPGEYRYDGDWAPVDGEGRWPAGKTVFLRADVQPPDEVPADQLHLAFNGEGLEGMISIDGRPYAGIDANHTHVHIPHARPFHLEGEFIAVPRVMCLPELASEQGRLRWIRLEQVDEAIEAAWYDLRFAWEASQVVKDKRRQQRIARALEDALLAIDLTLPYDRLRQEVEQARRILSEGIEQIAPDPEGGHIFLTGHSHIDTAWLWPIRETIRKCGRTFSTACRLMERYPDYRFSCSQPQLYAYTKQHYPTLYEEIKRWVREGRWETTGGMWVEADNNIPSGEALIRQILYGVQFFQKEFGTRPRVCWLPDVFGYPGNIPQILIGCGLTSFFTTKLHWQARNEFPYHLFWWEGIDGTSVLAHIPRLKRGYNGHPTPEELALAWGQFNEKGVYDEVLFPFGFGDGGGGPTAEMLEYAKRAEQYPGLPACRQGPEEAYFDRVRAASPELPTWHGELYLETHRGTYTTQAAIKRANRKNELLLREAEIAGVLARWTGADIAMDALHSAWENLLLLQFHDILPGSSIGQVYEEAARDHARIETIARGLRDTALRAIADRVPAATLLVFNSLSWQRNDIAAARVSTPGEPIELVAPDGQTIPAQVIARHDGEAEIVFAPQVPSLGYTTLTIRPAAQPPASSISVTRERLENRFFIIELNDIGEITRLYDKRYQREVIPPGERANRLQLFQDGPEREAAWNVHATFERREYPFEGETSIAVIETGPVRGAVRVARHHRDSRIEQDIMIYDTLPRIDFVTRADWQEREVMLKVAFPVEVLADQAAFEIQFGAIQRPTHRNTSWDQEKFEVPAHRWADLSEAGYGVSLLNDCKYGYDVKGNVLRLTLLRGPEWPDPNADRGHHEFTYSLWPHAGSWQQGGTVRSAWELNVPLVCVPATDGNGTLPATHSFIEVTGPAVVETLKPAEDGVGDILRLYEPNGGRGPVTVTSANALLGVEVCNLVEETEGPHPFAPNRFSFDIRPFQIRTFQLRLGTRE